MNRLAAAVLSYGDRTRQFAIALENEQLWRVEQQRAQDALDYVLDLIEAQVKP